MLYAMRLARNLALIFLVFVALNILLSCAPQRTIPKGMPYPRTLPRSAKVYPMEQVRCLGGGIGGCSPFNMVH